ncbi:MAG: aminotransferase class I/II-fold pyridoxal phosphate-dependent enzyme [Bacteroidota bacterium]
MIVADRLHSVKEYYFSRKLREVRGLIAQGKPIINMGIGSPDLPPPTSALDALNATLHQEGAHKYQSYQGLPELRAAMSNFYNERFGVEVNPENELLPLIGSKEGIMHISMAFLNVGDGVLVPNPGYPTYASVSKLLGAELMEYDLVEKNGWLPDIASLERHDLQKVKLMWVSYPNMPTGAKITSEKMQELVDFANNHDILLVNDNPYSFVLNNAPTSIFQIKGAKRCALELNSLSKTFNLAGWRVGMVIGNEAHVQAVLKVKSNMDSGMFYGIQKGAVAALQSGQDWFNGLDRTYTERKDLMFQLVEKLDCSYDSHAAGMFIWAKLPKGAKPAEEFIDEVLYEKNVFIAPGTIFGSNGEGYIRFSLCVPSEKIKEAISRF